MAELGEGLSGYLDVQDATLRAPRIEAVSNLAVGNTAPQHAFSVGSNLYVSTDSSNVLTVDGNVVCEGVKVGLIEIVPSYDFAAVSNVGNVTQSTIQFSNATTGFVTTANIEVGTANLFVDTTTGRVGIGKTDPGAALDVVGDVEISGETVLGTATYRKRRDWDRNALAYVYLGNVTTNNTTGIRLDVSLNNSTTGYQMFNFQITLQGNDASHAGGKLVYSVQGTRNDNISRDVHIGYVYVGIPGSFEYQLWLKDPTTDTTGDMDAYLNCQGYYNFDTGVSDVAQGGAAPTNFQDGTVGVLVDSTGNVGIGTTTPTGQLEVHGFGQTSFTSFNQAGNMGATLALRDDDGVAGSGGGIMFGADQGFFAAIRGTLTDGADNTSGELRFYTRNPPSSSTMQCNMTMDRSGNVGIGTTTPVGLLDVFGGSASSDSLMYVRNTANANTDRGAGIVFENRADNGTRFSLGHILALRENSVGSYSSYLRFSPTANGAPFEAMRIDASGNVGIGYATPTTYLDFGSPINNRIISLYGGTSKTSTDYYGFGINNGTFRYNVSSTGEVHRFYGNATEFGYVNNATGFVNSFTGQHKSFPHETLSGKSVDELSGLIVCASGEHISVNDSIPQRGKDGITVSEAVPIVCLSSYMNEKTVFGVVSNVEDPESTRREDRNGAFTSTFKKIVGDTRIYVNSIGEGAVWVVNTNGSFVNGDYITTSNVVGYGQKQDSDTLKNYTVAKITMDCDFAGTLIPKKRIKKKTVTETIEEIVEEEYESNMPEEIYTYDADRDCYMKTIKDNIKTNSRPVKQEYELRDSDGNIITEVVSNTITVEEYEALENKDGYVANITEGTEITENYTRIVNTPVKYTGDKVVVKTVTHEVDDLDEHGNLQWEDHPTETETLYKIRYLDASGAQTNEANAVHIAAFVGCTYHCG